MSREYYLAAAYGSGQYGECEYSAQSAACTSVGAPGTGQGSATQPTQDGSVWLVAAITCIALALFVVTLAQMIRRRTHRQP